MRKVKHLEIREEDLRLLRKEAECKGPMEACALLIGVFEGDVAKVLRTVVAENVKRSSTEFGVDPHFLLKVYIEAEKEGMEVIGIFHSHPAPPSPSSLDLKYMVVNPVVWLIISTLTGSVDAWQLFEGRVEPIKIMVL